MPLNYSTTLKMDQFVLMDYQPSNKEDVLVYYKGAFTASVLSQISINIRRRISRSKRVAKRVFSIFIELAQNVALYSTEINQLGGSDEEYTAGVGVFLIEDKQDYYLLTVGNLVSNQEGQRVAGKIDDINQLDENALRSLKVKQRAKPRYDGRHGANIGLIHVALQAAKPFKYTLREVNEYSSFLLLHVKIDKIS